MEPTQLICDAVKRGDIETANALWAMYNDAGLGYEMVPAGRYRALVAAEQERDALRPIVAVARRVLGALNGSQHLHCRLGLLSDAIHSAPREMLPPAIPVPENEPCGPSMTDLLREMEDRAVVTEDLLRRFVDLACYDHDEDDPQSDCDACVLLVDARAALAPVAPDGSEER